MAKNKATERAKTAEKVQAYLARHAAGDPDARGLSLEEVAIGAKCSRTPLSDPECPIMQQVRDAIDAARRALTGASAPPALATPATPPTPADLRARANALAPSGLQHLTDADLAQRIGRTRKSAGRVMKMWLREHGSGGSVDDATLARHDLERALWALRRVADELGPLVEARDEREAAKSTALAPAGTLAAQATLDLH